MGNSITKLFGIEKEETGLITTLLIQSVFLGIFYGVFNITAHSLFLAKFDETIMARAYILSGLVGSGLTYLYTLLQSRMKFTGFSIINLGFILAVTLVLWLFMTIYPENWVIFAIFIMLGPLNLLALLGFYGTTGRLFTLRQGKRLFGIIDTGIVVGVIVSSFAIPGLLSLNMRTQDIILISSGSILAAMIIQGIIGRNYRGLLLASASGDDKGEGMSVFRKDKYVRTMGLFIALSVVVMFFVQYSFMAVTRERYPEEQEMASFLGLFEGSMMVFTLLIKTFLFSYLIKNHGLKVTLAVGPVIIALFTVIAVVIGMSRGFVPGTAGFMIFFLILAVSRLFSKAMKDSVETPAFKVLYQTLSENVRFRVQSAIDGTINEIAALASGLLLTGLGALVFVKLIHFSWVLFVVVILWIVLGLILYNEYRNSVRRSLEMADEGGEEKGTTSFHNPRLKYGILARNDFFRMAEGSACGYDETDEYFKEFIVRSSRVSPDPLLIPVLRRIAGEKGGIFAGEAAAAILELEKTLVPVPEGTSLDIIGAVEGSEDKRAFIKSFAASGSQVALTDLLRLIRDNDMEVKRQAIFMSGKLQLTEMIPELCDCLSLPAVARDAYSVISTFGSRAFAALGSAFFRSSGSTSVRVLILRLFGESGSPDAAEFLLPRLWAVHKMVRREALRGLLKCGYNPDDTIKNRLLQEAQDIVGLLTRNISAKLCLLENRDDFLAGVVSQESEWWLDFLFDLISLLYDSHSIEKIRENLEAGTVESVNFALEMLDIVVDDSIKPILAALLDVIPDEDKLKTLFQFYPGSIPIYSELVVDLINTDYNHISAWTKSCALRSLHNNEKPADVDFIIALLFSPHVLLREEATRYLRENFKDAYEYCAYRIPPAFRDHLAKILNREIAEDEKIFDRVKFLSQFFPGGYSDYLVDMARRLKPVKNIEQLINNSSNSFILFKKSVNDEEAPGIFARWEECGINNLPAEYDIPVGESGFLITTDQLSDCLFTTPELLTPVLTAFDKNLLKNE